MAGIEISCRIKSTVQRSSTARALKSHLGQLAWCVNMYLSGHSDTLGPKDTVIDPMDTVVPYC
jgi:hypothetical protein